MKEIPQELQDIITNPKLVETVQQQPGSERFHAAVLGLAAMKYLRDQTDSRTDLGQKPEKSPHENIIKPS